MSVHLYIVCLVCINIQYTWNYAEFVKKCIDFTQFLTQTCNESTRSDDHLHTELVQMKFRMVTLHPDNHRQSFWQLIDRSLGSMCLGLAESNSQLAHISAGQCLKFRYDNHLVQCCLPHLMARMSRYLSICRVTCRRKICAMSRCVAMPHLPIVCEWCGQKSRFPCC